MSSRPLISVVTPFYNTERYLRECIESVLAQSYPHFEYILVDNQSTDTSHVIAEEYARRDDRVRVLRTERFLPQLENYNFALRQISPASRYCKIVQADDWLFPRCLEEMLAAGEAHPGAAIVSSYRLKGRRLEGAGLDYHRRMLSGREACRLHLLEGVYLFGSPSTLMYSADVVRSRRPFFNETRLHADTEASYEILLQGDLAFAHQVLSFTRLEPESISGRVRDLDPEPLSFLIVLRRYGPSFLSAEEYSQRLQSAEDEYQRRLGIAWLKRREAAYWEYHRHGLDGVGQRIESWHPAWYALKTLGVLLLSPAVLARTLLERRVSSELPRDGSA